MKYLNVMGFFDNLGDEFGKKTGKAMATAILMVVETCNVIQRIMKQWKRLKGKH